MNHENLASFNRVALHGGFRQAGRVTGKSKATLSRHVRELEQELQVRLVERGGRTLRLTEEGAYLHTSTADLLAEIEDAAQAILGGVTRPRGRLRVNAPILLAHSSLGRVAADFIARYPDVQLEITADDRAVDPVAEGYDMVIRVNPGADDGLIGRCFLHDERLVVASPAIERPKVHGSGVTVPGILLEGAGDERWFFHNSDIEISIAIRPVLKLSTLIMVRDAAVSGAGAAILPRAFIENDLSTGKLIEWGSVLHEPVEIWIMHSSRRLVSPKVTAFIQFLCFTYSTKN